MKHYRLPDFAPEQSFRLPFFLAMEEWVAKRMSAGAEDAFFIWQVSPTVIFGRNQRIEAEVDADYCRRNGIACFRRKSGGGCVFADRSNMMISYITASARPMPEIFAHYTAMVAGMLREMGIAAESSGRNDITIGGRKVSGNAFYRTATGVSIVHGTMLYDTDMGHMARAITPSRSKLESKGVKSVESRITVLKEHTAMTLPQVRAALERSMATSEQMLGEGDIAAIRAIEQQYYSPGWIMGTRMPGVASRMARVDGAGEIEATLSLDEAERIADIDLAGDFFPLADIDTTLLSRLRGVERTREAIERALAGVDVGNIIAGLDNERFINLISL